MKKVVLITGASAGMGKETAKLLAKEGFIVYAAARRTDRMKDLEALSIKTLSMDVTQDTDMVNGVNTIINAEGRIDVLINNAGFGQYGAIEDVSMDDARYQLEVNVLGAARLSQLVLPGMRKQRWGRIINISSIGGKFALPLGGWYHASKFALEALSDSLRNEVKPFGIDVVVIEPGGVKSEWAGIATENALKSSSDSAYGSMTKKFAATSQQFEDRGADPIVIAKLMLEAIRSKQPRTRYHGGYLAGLLLFMNKILPDRMMDKVLSSRLK